MKKPLAAKNQGSPRDYGEPWSLVDNSVRDTLSRNAGEGLETRLLLCGEEVLEAAQGERIAGDAKAGDDALTDCGGLRGGAAADRV